MPVHDAPRRADRLQSATAECDHSGMVIRINDAAKQRWGWRRGHRLPDSVLESLRSEAAEHVRFCITIPDGTCLSAAPLSPGKAGWRLSEPMSSIDSSPEDPSSFKTLIEKIPVIVVRFRDDGEICLVHPGSRKIVGCSVADWPGKNFIEDVIHSDDQVRLMDAMERTRSGEEDPFVLRYFCGRETARYAEVNLFHIDEGGFFDAVLRDVTEQREVEDALFETAAFYRAFLEQSPIGMLHLDAVGTVTFENHPFRQIVGEEAEDSWVGLSVFSLDAVDPKLHPALRSVLDHGISFHGAEACFAPPNDSETAHLLVHGAPIRNQDNDLIGAVLMIEDVTSEKRHREEAALRARYDQAEADLRAVALESDDDRAFLDESVQIIGRTAHADRVQILFYAPTIASCVSRAEWVSDLARSVPLRIRPDDYPVLRDIATPKNRKTIVAPHDGAQTRPLLALSGARESRWIPLYLEGGLGGFIVLEWIITAASARKVEEVLIDQVAGVFESLWIGVQARTRYKHTIANIDDGLFNFTFSDEGARLYLLATHQFEKLIGYPPSLLVDHGDAALRWREDVLHPSDRALVEEHDAKLQRGEEGRVVYRILHRDGSVRWLREHGTPGLDATGHISVSGILSDITEQKNAEEILRRAKRQAEASDEAKTAFIARMSHEIRTPLGAVHGYAELMANELREIPNLPPEMTEFAESIHERAQHLLGLVNNLFDLSSIDSGELHVQRVPLDLQDILRPLIERYETLAEEKGLAFRCLWASGVSKVMSDPRRLKQIVDNLLSNALKFTERGNITLRTEQCGAEVVIEVSDTGIGMNEAYVDRLFTSFSQEEDWRNRQFEGTGLGLAFARRLVDLLGGRIEAHSRKGKGSRFSVYLPTASEA